MLKRFQRSRQVQIVHIVGDKRIVGGADAELHRQIKAGGGFAAARHAEQDHLRLIEVAQRNAVIVRRGIVDGGDAGIVLAEVAGGQAMGAVRHRRRFHVQLALQRADQRLHDIWQKPRLWTITSRTSGEMME